MLEWMQRLTQCRRWAPEIGLGSYSLLEVDRPEVLAFRFEWNGRTLISLQVGGPTFELGPFGYRWLHWSDAIGMV